MRTRAFIAAVGASAFLCGCTQRVLFLVLRDTRKQFTCRSQGVSHAKVAEKLEILANPPAARRGGLRPGPSRTGGL